jgi:hypothetical protein
VYSTVEFVWNKAQMTAVLTPSLTVAPRVRVRKLRELPVSGKVLVAVGDTVAADTVVASAERSGDLDIVRIAERMGIEPLEVTKGLKVFVGQRVSRGDLLCEHAGLFGLLKSRLTAPVDGVVEFFAEGTGHLGIRLAPKRIELRGYIAGTVVAVEPQKSVTVQTEAALVQGIFGVGGERTGIIAPLSVPNDAVVRPEDLPSDCRGRILIGGKCPTSQTLSEAQRRGAAGFVVGSIDDRTLASYVGFDVGVAITGDEAVTMSLIITEGFGEIPISNRITDLFTPLAGCQASLNGTTQVRAGAVRPEIIVPGAAPVESAAVTDVVARGLTLGALVRLIRFPFFGLQGQVTELPHSLERIETGAHARVLRVKLADGRVVTVPRANVELL